MMKILGIETSCDETAICLMEAVGNFGPDFKFKILGNALNSQAALHAEYGGVFPNLAKREHAKNLVPMLKEALTQAGALQNMAQQRPIQGESLESLKLLLSREPELLEQVTPFFGTYEKPNVDAIAVTAGPGLEPALWVGINFAKALALACELPIVAVNHMEGHIIMSLVESEQSNIPKYMSMFRGLKTFEFPALALLISGGHTELVLSRSFGEYERIGETRDDAAGEAFDKIARLLDLPYPGGAEISRLAALARKDGAEPRSKLTPPMLNSKDYDFSFSGLKTEARKLVEKNAPLSEDAKGQVALATENAIAEVLVAKTMRAAEEFGAQTIVVGGGVSANTFIRRELSEALAKTDASAQLLVPPPELATDNAIMIALAGYFHALKQDFVNPADLKASGNLRLESRL